MSDTVNKMVFICSIFSCVLLVFPGYLSVCVSPLSLFLSLSNAIILACSSGQCFCFYLVVVVRLYRHDFDSLEEANILPTCIAHVKICYELLCYRTIYPSSGSMYSTDQKEGT